MRSTDGPTAMFNRLPPISDAMILGQHEQEVARGGRFEFGKNWGYFLEHLDEHRIKTAEASLLAKLNVSDLKDKTFLDIGSGSGLFSLAARRLGANVHSFDYDPQSVACTRRLKDTYFPNDPAWKIEEGSVLDENYIRSLGQFDIVYSWGVLHHTGDMWRAIGHAQLASKPGGKIFIAIYNDQGRWSRRWRLIKRLYNRLPKLLKLPYAVIVMGVRELPQIIKDVIRLSPGRYVRRWTRYADNRGMSYWHDLVDWVGGYPFEVATPEQVFEFFKQRGFRLDTLKTCSGDLGTNEFVYTRTCSIDRA
jgi:2-polyprenyl-3-methyl-5-hydroxy-6-metoxy-1,4-benzoquinol methylase